MGSMYGIYANIGGILMGSMLPYIACMDPMRYDMAGIYSKHLIVFTCTYSTIFSDPEVYVQKNYIQQLKVPAYGACIYIYSHASHMYIHLNQNTAIWLGSGKV